MSAHRRHIVPRRDWTFSFDQGSISTMAEDGGKIRITPKLHWNSQWFWWALSSTRLGGTTPHFLIAKASHYNLATGMWLACWATNSDADTWYAFDSVAIGASDIEFYNNVPFPNQCIYIAALPMYPYKRSQRKIAEWWRNTSLVSSLAYAGQSTRRDNGDGRTTSALPYDAFKVTNATANTKNTGVLSAGNHPHETPGRWMLEGAVDWLLTSSVKRDLLLDWFNFYIYPTLNPQGIAGGWFRSSPETPSSDSNRIWNTTGTNEAVDAYKSIWNTHWSNAFEVALDYHSWVDADGSKSVAYDSTGTLWVKFLAEMAKLDSTFVKRADDTTASMLTAYHYTLSPTKFFGVMDHGHISSLGPANWKTAGEQSMIAIANMLAGGYWTNGPGYDIGSRVYDGVDDRIEFNNPGDLTGHALTICVWCDITGVPTSGNGYLFNIQSSGDTSTGIVISYASGRVSMVIYGSSSTYMNHYCDGTGGSTSFQVVNAGWTNVITTYDGNFNVDESCKLYKNGVAVTSAYQAGTAPESTKTGKLVIAGRSYDNTRNGLGKIAQVAVWDRVLNATERADLAAGLAPDHVDGGSNLIFYFKAHTTSLVATVGGTGTANGTTHSSGAGNGPCIFY